MRGGGGWRGKAEGGGWGARGVGARGNSSPSPPPPHAKQPDRQTLPNLWVWDLVAAAEGYFSAGSVSREEAPCGGGRGEDHVGKEGPGGEACTEPGWAKLRRAARAIPDSAIIIGRA